ACGEGGFCLTFTYSGEQFCSAPCDSNSCPEGYSCEQLSTSAGVPKQCVPADQKQPKCVPSLHGTMETNDIFTDFAMVGYTDTDGDGSILTTADGAGEPAKRIKFSEYAANNDFKVILFNVAAGWCGPCQQETTGFKQLLKTYPKLGIYQVLFDGATQNTPAKLDLARNWIKKLGGVGATGVDFDKSVSPINTAGSTPLNMIIDAKTFKILKKFNGAPAGGMASTLAPYFK
ncbi:MAG: redoxin domain-containing protein, partial [Deltaproteobacteria bacterium]|nr:redoxin domain-containing protein [Deltaproteobacteria bacterium]